MKRFSKPHPIRKILAANLRAERGRKEMTQAELAKGAGLPQATISELERGVRNINLDAIGKISTVLKVRPARLFFEE